MKSVREVNTLLTDVPQELLITGLQHTMKAVAMNNSVILLAHVNGLTLDSSNMSMSIRYDIPVGTSVTVQQTGTIAVPSRYFNDIIRKLPAGTLVTLAEEENLILSIKAGQSVYRLCGTNPAELLPPSAPGPKANRSILIPNEALKTIVRQVAFAVSTSETRPILTGVCFRVDGNTLRLTATDGVRFASRETKVENRAGIGANIVIPGKNLSYISRILKDVPDSTEICLGEKRISFKSRNLAVHSAVIDGTFPALENKVPQSFTTEITVDTAGFLHAVERVTLLAGENVIRLYTSMNNKLELASNTPEIGDVHDEVGLADMSGQGVGISFNGKYMQDILRCIDSGQVKVGFAGGNKPIVITPVTSFDNTSALYLISPILSHSAYRDRFVQ
ncbi:DNA polymerase III subunit beta [Paenibacillus sp. sptzw28]|uniref:DNA polymerase III subunit beta n=1 Tax=Paenibacillus sp. sptzw28 TaxID=715179 RepID=UPI001C6E1F77|nr:DNA polymerase III subunit beta [Paenibacillus sp. sptzw28]QYR23206.1 DNA polymerase III subunit beta [Paenibacillus sp. sptzw28]